MQNVMCRMRRKVSYFLTVDPYQFNWSRSIEGSNIIFNKLHVKSARSRVRPRDLSNFNECKLNYET